MSIPLVSIGFPVYNGEKSLRQAMDSVLSQDFKDFEVVICDNASTDSTAAICQEYARRDARVRYFRNETNIGVNPNHNRAFELSRGKYFAWLAHDVEQLPGMLSRCVREMNLSSPPVVLVYPGCEQIDDEGQLVGEGMPSIASNDPRAHRRMRIVIQRISYVTQHYGLFASEALRKTHLNGSYPSADHVLTAELAMLGEIRELPEVLIRRHYGSQDGTRSVSHDKHAWTAWLDPKMQGRHLWLRVQDRLALEYIRSAFSLPLRPMDKLACAVVGPLVHYRRYIPETIGFLRSQYGIQAFRSKFGIRAWRSRFGRLKHRLLG